MEKSYTKRQKQIIIQLDNIYVVYKLISICMFNIKHV